MSALFSQTFLKVIIFSPLRLKRGDHITSVPFPISLCSSNDISTNSKQESIAKYLTGHNFSYVKQPKYMAHFHMMKSPQIHSYFFRSSNPNPNPIPVNHF